MSESIKLVICAGLDYAAYECVVVNGDRADAAAGCEHAAGQDYPGKPRDFVAEWPLDCPPAKQVPPLSKAPQKPPTRDEAEAYVAAVTADARKIAGI